MRRLLVLSVLVLAFLPLHAREPRVRKSMVVTTDWLARRLANSNMIVLDVGRDRQRYDRAHIPGAQFVALSDITTTRREVPNELPDESKLVELIRTLGIDGHKRVVLYDDADGLLAARMYFTLDYAGLGHRAALLDGGWKKWAREERPASAAAEPPRRRTKFKLRMPRDVVVTLSEAREMSRASMTATRDSAVLLDARPGEQYRGELDQHGPPAGHLPGAKSLYWKDALVPGDAPVLKSVEELRALFRAKGASRRTPVVTYCWSGVQAAHAYFVAKYLGYDARLFDGSFLEWRAARGTSVATGTDATEKISAVKGK